ncbi:MAG: HAD family hydrolase [Comamonadaceae bacterium]|nr:HAD family hydrolase [Comamonadaceae bacterium]
MKAAAGLQRPALFVDKDGTLVVDVPYNAEPAQVRWRLAVPQALAALARAGFAIVVVSNQRGIALGRFSAAQFDDLKRAMRQRLLDEAGVELTDFLHCPHDVDADGRPVCRCRKPEPGMLLDAAERHGLDLAASWMVGDTLDDVEAGRRAGRRAILYDSGGETLWQGGPLRTPHARLADWDEVVHRLIADRAAEARA